ncbi:hypothetical protein KPP03845_105236 [Streptomyces xanthophaeus]|uniref:hypothetical protein n=1 Tax=Streptomyces xanthophaeus TaxID=67385 RepID=UPI00233F67C9|nr:hypothetical protein [Streptomyces xanthophaeus]WCD88826.1 hypothetical protein KPP03845_105236 [Streptomyces xanthophaeus]
MDTTKPPAPNAPEAGTTPADLKKTTADAEPALAPSAETARTPETAENAGAAEELGEDLDLDGAEDEDEDAAEEQAGGVAAGAAAIVAAGLSLVALSGTWVSRVLAERQGLVGQIEGNKSAPPADQIAALYGDGWQLTALVNGVVATLALLIAVFVLARPAFGAPGRTLPTWVRAVSWAAVTLGALGILVFGFLYFLPLPKVPA